MGKKTTKSTLRRNEFIITPSIKKLKIDNKNYDFEVNQFYCIYEGQFKKHNGSLLIIGFYHAISEYYAILLEGSYHKQLAFIQWLSDQIRHANDQKVAISIQHQWLLDVSISNDLPLIVAIVDEIFHNDFLHRLDPISFLSINKIDSPYDYDYGRVYSFEGEIQLVNPSQNIITFHSDGYYYNILIEERKKPSNKQILTEIGIILKGTPLKLSIISGTLLMSIGHSLDPRILTNWESIAFDIDIPLLKGITYRKSTSAQLSIPILQPSSQQNPSIPLNQQIYLNEFEQIIQSLGEDDPRILQLSQLPSTIRLPFTPDLEAKFWRTSLKHLNEGEEPLLDALVKLASTFDISPALYLEMKAKLQVHFRNSFSHSFLTSVTIT